MNKKLKKGLTISTTAAMGMGIVLPTVSVLAAPVTANGWVLENGNWYYYVNGVKLVNGWAKDSHGWCYLGADGTAIKEGWAKDSIGWCYIRNYNWVDHATWAKDSAGWQYIGANGYWDSSVAPKATNPIDDATAAVVKAEASKAQADVDAAKAAVEALKGAVPEAADLMARINAINVVFEVSSVSTVDATHVKVVFSQKVDEASATDTNNYKFPSSSLKVNEANLQSDGKTVVLTLDDANPLTNDSSDDYTVKITGVKNLSGVKIPDYKEIVNLYDDVAPTVDSLNMKNRDELDIWMSENVTNVNTTNVKVYDPDGSKISVSVKVDKDDKNKIVVTGLGSQDDGDYTVVLSNVKDYAGNRIASNTTEDFTLEADNTDPKISSITAVSDNTLKITFSEPVDYDSYPFDVTAYSSSTGDLTVNSIKAVSNTDNKSYYIVFGGDQDESISFKVTVSNYYDFAGNKGDTKTKFVKFGTSTPSVDDTAATVKTFNGKKYAVVTFDQDVNNGAIDKQDLDATFIDADDNEFSTTIDANKIFTSDDSDGSTDMSDYIDDNQIAISLSGLDKGDYTVTLPDGFVNVYGATSDETDITFTVSTDTSNAAEVYYIDTTAGGKYAAKNGVYYVIFTDSVDSSALNTNNYRVVGVGSVFDKASFVAGYVNKKGDKTGDYVSATDKQIVKLEVESGAIDTNGRYKIKVSNITDADGNDVDDYTSDYIDFVNSQGPSVDKAVLVDLDTIEVYFDKSIDTTQSTVDTKDFQVVVDGSTVSISKAVPADADKKVWTLTLKNEIDSDYSTVKAGTSSVFDGKDIYGNKGDTNSLVTAKEGSAYNTITFGAPKVTTVPDTSTTLIEGTAYPRSTVYIAIGTTTYSGSADPTTGAFSIAIPAQADGTVLNVTCKKSDGTVSQTTSVTVHKILSSIAVTTPATKLTYKVGDTLDITGLVVKGTYSDGSQDVLPITADNITGFDSSAVTDSETLTITYGGKTTTYTIKVVKADGVAVSGVTADYTAKTLDGVTSAMEYSTDSGVTWTKGTGVQLTGLSGTVQVRNAEDATHNAGPITAFNFL